MNSNSDQSTHFHFQKAGGRYLRRREGCNSKWSQMKNNFFSPNLLFSFVLFRYCGLFLIIKSVIKNELNIRMETGNFFVLGGHINLAITQKGRINLAVTEKGRINLAVIEKGHIKLVET